MIAIAPAAEPLTLMPLAVVPDQLVLQTDFSKPGEIDKRYWARRQGTQWEIVDGVLRGTPSTPEYQASRKDHRGLEPRISAPITTAPKPRSCRSSSSATMWRD